MGIAYDDDDAYYTGRDARDDRERRRRRRPRCRRRGTTTTDAARRREKKTQHNNETRCCSKWSERVHGRDDEIARRRAPAGAGAEAGVPGFILRRRRPDVVETANRRRRCQQRNARETDERIDRFRRRARESHAFEPVPQYHTLGLGARRRRVRRRHTTVSRIITSKLGKRTQKRLICIPLL